MIRFWNKILCFVIPVFMLMICGCNSIELPEIKAHVKTEAPIEKKFLESGPEKIRNYTESANDFKLKTFRIWYPERLETEKNKRFPLIVFCNGTGYRATRFSAIFRHLASWGFIVVGTDEEWSGKGRGAILSLRFVLDKNQDPKSIFYQKINLDQVGIAGHSQGGAGAINAITRFKDGQIFKALFTISGAKQEQASHWVLRCPYDPGKLRIPVMMTATSNPYGWDEANPEREHLAICPLDSMQKNRDDILKNGETTVVIARVANKKKYHADNLAMSAPYMTAWFLYWLKGDKEAGKFFAGNTPELKNNLCWQDVEIHHANEL